MQPLPSDAEEDVATDACPGPGRRYYRNHYGLLPAKDGCEVTVVEANEELGSENLTPPQANWHQVCCARNFARVSAGLCDQRPRRFG